MVGLCSKVSVQLDFWKNQVFGKVSLFTVKFLCDQFWTSPTHLYRQFNDFHQKNIDKLVQDQFLHPVKDHPYDKFGYVVYNMPFLFL